MNELWRELRDQLKLQVVTNVDDKSDPSSPVVINFTVTNNASPPGQDSPEIRFESVSLKVGIPPDWHTENMGTLEVGESATYQHRCRYVELPDIEYDLEGTASPQAFFRMRRAHRIPADGDTLNAKAYLQVFKEVGIHRWLNSAIKSISSPDEDKTLGHLEAQIGPLDTATAEIRGTQARLQRLLNFMSKEERTLVSGHSRIVELYLGELVRSIGEIIQSLRSGSPQQLSGVVVLVVSRLEGRAARLDEATGTLGKLSASP